jgi:AcrR family transcriptional regulator
VVRGGAERHRRVGDVSKAHTVAQPKMSPNSRSSNSGDAEARARVIDATVASILELGFYRASTNEIARRAGVTWGVIQHYFGTREALMLAVLQKGAAEFIRTVGAAHIEGETATERIEQLITIFSDHYAQPTYLANLQILLNMDRDPRTSSEVRRTMIDVAERSNVHVRRLMREALGPSAKVPDLMTTVFLVLRGFGLSQQLLGTMSYDAVVPKKDRLARQRQLLTQLLAPTIESFASEGA